METQIQNQIALFKQLEKHNERLYTDFVAMFSCQLNCSKDVEIISRRMSEEVPAFNQLTAMLQQELSR